jgi:hypothetical protein
LSTSLPPDVLLGSQEPTFQVVPPAVRNSADDVIELAASAGLILDDWQQNVIRGSCGERSDGRWSAFEVGVVVPRQNGKGSIIEARELAGLFLFGERLILHSAHEFKTAREAFLRIKTLIDGSKDLSDHVKRIHTGAGNEGIELKNGARLRFIARSSGSARGFSGDCVFLDEAYHLSPAMIAAMLPTLSARPNPQIWYTTSSPPEVDVLSEQIRKVRERAMSDKPGRLAWLEWSSPLDVDPFDVAAVARVNPALNRRIDAEFVDAERSAMPLDAWMVERLGVWRSTSLSSKIPLGVWESTVSDARPDLSVSCFAVDMPPERDGASIAVSDGRVIDLAVRGRGTDWVLGECIRLWDAHKPVAFVIDGFGPAAGLVSDLESAGARVVVTKAPEMATACGRLFDALINAEVGHADHADLTTAVLGASTRKLGDRWAWSRSSSGVDISPLVAATLALFGATTLEREAPAAAPVFAY